MHTVLFVTESSINGSLCSERISGQQQGSCESGIDHCGMPGLIIVNVVCWDKQLSIQDNQRELNHKP